jgi:peptidoglycan/xylan/chitin deacetylase (PgdA/CDA1 family)
VSRKRRLAAALTRLTGGTAALVVGVGALSAATPARPLPAEEVEVNGTRVTVRGDWPVVDDALAAARIVRTDGRLLSAGTGKVLDAHADPENVSLDGRTATGDEPLRHGSRIDVHVGVDRVEPVATRTAPLPGGGLPPVEFGLWNQPHPGSQEETFGAVSGEVLSRRVVTAPGPAAPDLSHTVALTFDDGPDPHVTPALLDVLQFMNVKATFCVIGYLAQRYPQIVRDIAARGHTLCDHTAHHVEHLDRHPQAEQEAEIQGGFDAIRSITGAAPLFYRAPGGSLSPAIIDAARMRGMRVLGWTVDTKDYLPTPPLVLLLRSLASARPGAVLLMHDGGGDGRNTLAMMGALIRELRARGYAFRTP